MLDRRNVLASLLAIPATVAISRLEAKATTPGDDYVRKWVHPDLRPMAAAMLAAASGDTPLSLATLPQRRALLAGTDVQPTTAASVELRRVPGLGNNPDVTVYLINARPGTSRPAIVHTHGGGFVAGAAKAAIPALSDLSLQLDCVILTVEYRLAPETRYAGSIDDNYAALKWLHRSAEELGVDPRRIAVMGESAGGGHAALLAIAARDRGEVPLAFQCLIYPMLDDRTGSSMPVPDHVGRIIWSAADNRFGWECFLGTRPGHASVPASAVPARVPDLRGLPPAFIGVGSLDLFHREDVLFAERLNESGVATELIVVPGAFHVFDAMPAAVSQRFNAAKISALKTALRDRTSER